MGDKLKPGGLGSKNFVGIPPEFASSMAAAMETELNLLLSSEGRDTVSTDNTTETRDRRILFLAIARGIVNHLVTNQDSFVLVDDGGAPLVQHHVRIGHE